jgi:hypothetical protein
MDPRSVIANRIDLGLRRQLGEGVDARRTLTDARYARDVLLVCEALKGTDLPVLARQFRAAGQHIAVERSTGGHQPGPAQDWAVDTSGFGVADVPAEKPKEAKPSWFSPGRWLS